MILAQVVADRATGAVGRDWVALPPYEPPVRYEYRWDGAEGYFEAIPVRALTLVVPLDGTQEDGHQEARQASARARSPSRSR